MTVHDQEVVGSNVALSLAFSLSVLSKYGKNEIFNLENELVMLALLEECCVLVVAGFYPHLPIELENLPNLPT